eukprot:753861-Hanusia_phi.AAC.7
MSNKEHAQESVHLVFSTLTIIVVPLSQDDNNSHCVELLPALEVLAVASLAGDKNLESVRLLLGLL